MASIHAGKARNPDRLVKAVLGEGADLTNIKAVKYGKEKEAQAREEYRRHHERLKGHPVKVANSGLVVHKGYPQISASPDGLVDCKCGLGLVEIKCPYTSRGKEPGAHLDCLHQSNGKLKLKKTHSYYTQCQQQLGVTGRAYCDFFVYCGKGMVFLERVFPDQGFMAESLRLVTDFFVRFVAPALVGGGCGDSGSGKKGGVETNGCEKMGGVASKSCEKDENRCRENEVVVGGVITLTVSTPLATGGREVLMQVNVNQHKGPSPGKPVAHGTRARHLRK